MSTILVTGGAGYIGSHTTLALLEAGYQVVVLDNLCNSSTESLKRVAEISGLQPEFVEGDVRDECLLRRVFEDYSIEAVLHFAGLKAVGESTEQPLTYFDNNVHGSLNLLKAMARAGVFRFVFSSSATVYGEAVEMPVAESSQLGPPTNPYGRSKLIVEDILRDLARSDRRWRVAILRYFNPVGAHKSGLIGEDPEGVPNNLLPFIAQVAIGRLPSLSIFGDDYPTPDGTGVRDYIHVVDLADGHLRALCALANCTGAHEWNLGTGRGYSVLEMVRAFEEVSGRVVPYQVVPRRPGDVGTCFANPSKAERELNWKAAHSLKEMLRDAWLWQRMNPSGYR